VTWIIATIPVMLLAVALATLPVLHAMRHARQQLRSNVAKASWPTVQQLERGLDVQSPVRAAA